MDGSVVVTAVLDAERQNVFASVPFYHLDATGSLNLDLEVPHERTRLSNARPFNANWACGADGAPSEPDCEPPRRVDDNHSEVWNRECDGDGTCVGDSIDKRLLVGCAVIGKSCTFYRVPVAQDEITEWQVTVQIGAARVQIVVRLGSIVRMTLRSPDGTIYGPDGAGPVAAYTVDDVSETYEIVNPAPGDWTVELLGVEIAPEGEDVLLTLFVLESSGPVVEIPPAADAGEAYETDEGESVTLNAVGSWDPDGHITLYEWDLDNDGEYDDATGVFTDVIFDDNGVYAVGLRVTDDSGQSDTDTADVTVLNVAPEVNVDLSTQEVQYSDSIADVTVTGTDVAADSMSASTSWSVDGGSFATGLPSSLALSTGSCNISENTNTCNWTLSGIADVTAGEYTVRVTVEDDDGDQADTDITITVLSEDADIWLDNPAPVEVDSPGGDSGAFSLTAYVQETATPTPLDCGAPDPGDINNAAGGDDVDTSGTRRLPPYDVMCTSVGPVTSDDYDAVLEVSCDFDDVAVNTYHAQATVIGDYYIGGPAEDVLVVYDPAWASPPAAAGSTGLARRTRPTLATL